MCGIAGLVRLDGGPIDEPMLDRMTSALAHRGPDAHGLHVEPGIGLGHRRLSVIDLAGGAQPMHGEGAVLVFNGEIYNFVALRDQLAAAGHRFATRSDTEVVLRGWEEWGEGVVERLDGMFAFAVWDRRRQLLLLARDRLGKKPLHYAVLPNGLAFASELRAFAACPALRRQVDPRALQDYLALGYVPDPLTIFAGVAKLPPAHTLLLDRQGPPGRVPAPERYWHPGRSGPASAGSFAEAASTLRERLVEATGRRLVADVPLGAFLSGGIDSAGVVAAAMRARGNDPIDSFTIGFPGADDEAPAAAAIARHCGAAHLVERADDTDWSAGAGEQGRIFGEPFGDPSALPTAQVCRLARRHVTVALSGDGGDEVFAGYRRHRWHMLVEGMRRHLPAGMRHGPIAAIARLYPKLDRAPRFLRARHTLTELSLDSALGYYRTMARMQDERRAALLHPVLAAGLDGYDPGARFAQLMRDSGSDDPLAQAQHVDLATWLPGQMLVKTDRTSMATGLEVRCPLLDPGLVSWGLALPASYKLRQGQGKAVLRAAVSPWLPPEILRRPKQGFAMPLGRILADGIGRVRARLLHADFLDHRLIRADALRRLLDEHESGRVDHAQPIWLLLVLAGFLRSELAPPHVLADAA